MPCYNGRKNIGGETMVTMYDVKTKLLTLISLSSSDLQPQATHVLANWKTNVWKLRYNSFPLVTVRIIDGRETYQYGFKTPSLSHGQYFNYLFTAYVYGRTMNEARGLGDGIMDYLAQNNKHRDSNIIDITGLSIRESIMERGTQRMYVVIVSGVLITEEEI